MAGRAQRPTGRKRSKSFDRKADAKTWLAEQQTAIARGIYVDPSEGRITLEEYAARWLPTKVRLRETSRARIETTLRAHLIPALGDRPLASIRRSDVQAFVSSLWRVSGHRPRCERPTTP